MELKRILPLVGLFLLAGCGDNPEEHMLAALQKHSSKFTLFPNEIRLHSTTCGNGTDANGKTYYDCSVSFSETDISGIARQTNLNVVLVKDSSDWYLATK